MQIRRALQVLVLGLSAISVAEATFANLQPAARDGKALQQRRPEDEEADTTSSSTTSQQQQQTTTTTSSSRTTETTSSSSSSTSSSTSSEPGPEPTNATPKPTDTPTTKTSPTTSSGAEPTEPPETTSPSETLEPTTHIITQIITSTRADGSEVTYTTETLTTVTPGLANGGNSNQNQNTGLSTQTRNTIIGVVVGVGGAIVLGGLALVAWRIWGRKKHQEENDGLMDYHSAIDSKPDTGGSMSTRTPFQSTLESYHAPTQVNTAANF